MGRPAGALAMKQFRGTLTALALLLVLVGAYFGLKPKELTPKERKELMKQDDGVKLFAFEKADLVRIDVTRPDGTLSLVEKPDAWWIEGTEMRAGRQMVNKTKHQLHDLVSRATVTDTADEAALYGLGPNAIRVKVTLRDGSTREFDAGDPNPSGVSYYIRRVGDDTIYTVKKSAMDFYSLSLSEFRERRIGSFDTKDVDGLYAELPGGKTLKIQSTGERMWDLLEPVQFAANDMEVRGLLGRISAMKAIKFVDDSQTGDLAILGLQPPRARISVLFSGGRDPITLELGRPSGEKDGEYPLAYAKLADEPFVYQVRDVFLEDFLVDPSELRLTQFARMDQNKLVSLQATFAPPDADDADLAGTVLVRQAAGEWQWDDGVIAPGSTPRRVAQRVCDIDSDEFVSDRPDDAKYGFDKPVAKVDLVDDTGRTATILIGKPAKPTVDEEGNERARWYARHAAFPEVYIVADGAIDVIRDLMREHGRHARGEAEQEEREARIESEKKAVRESERQERIIKHKAEKADKEKARVEKQAPLENE